MDDKKMKVLLYLKKSSRDRSGKAPIMGRITLGIIRKTICPKSQNDLSEDWGDTTAFFGRVVFGWFVYP